jgi:hypothetical protein
VEFANTSEKGLNFSTGLWNFQKKKLDKNYEAPIRGAPLSNGGSRRTAYTTERRIKDTYHRSRAMARFIPDSNRDQNFPKTRSYDSSLIVTANSQAAWASARHHRGLTHFSGTERERPKTREWAYCHATAMAANHRGLQEPTRLELYY